MSRVGNKAIILKEGVSISVGEGNEVTVRGPKGELTKKLSPKMKIVVEGNTVKVIRPGDAAGDRELHGTTRALLNGMAEGVSEGFTKTLIIFGVGYKFQMENGRLSVHAGYSHNVDFEIPEGITVTCPKATEAVISGCDKQAVGQLAAEIRAVRKPEPYLGKGIRYKNEIIRRKEGKKAK